MFSVDLHTFAKEEEAVKGCCGCKTDKLRYPRVYRVTMLVVNDAKMAEAWQRRILWAMQGKPYQEATMPKKRHVLVLINPFSNNGASTQVWEDARLIMENAYMELTVKETERARHAFEIV